MILIIQLELLFTWMCASIRQQSSWNHIIEGLRGSFSAFSCEFHRWLRLFQIVCWLPLRNVCTFSTVNLRHCSNFCVGLKANSLLENFQLSRDKICVQMKHTSILFKREAMNNKTSSLSRNETTKISCLSRNMGGKFEYNTILLRSHYLNVNVSEASENLYFKLFAVFLVAPTFFPIDTLNSLFQNSSADP